MASRYERIFLLTDIQNNANSPVDILAGAILQDVITQERFIQLKLLVKGTKPATKISVDIVECNAEGEESRYPGDIETTTSFPVGVPFSDVLIPAGGDAVSIKVSVSTVEFGELCWSVGRGFSDPEYTVTITRKKQFFIVNPPIKVSIDNGETFDLNSGACAYRKLRAGEHSVKFKLSFRETIVKLDVNDTCSLEVSCNRATGLIDVDTLGASGKYVKHS